MVFVLMAMKKIGGQSRTKLVAEINENSGINSSSPAINVNMIYSTQHNGKNSRIQRKTRIEVTYSCISCTNIIQKGRVYSTDNMEWMLAVCGLTERGVRLPGLKLNHSLCSCF